MKGTALMHRIMLACSTGACRLFRQNVGLAWIGKSKRFTKIQVVTVRPGDVLIRNARPFKAGIKGQSDLAGWTSIEVTAEMVGQLLAVFTAIEVKGAGDRLKADQKDYLSMVENAGGKAGVARSVEDAEGIISETC